MIFILELHEKKCKREKNMKNIIIVVMCFIGYLGAVAQCPAEDPNWEVVWEDDFIQTTTVPDPGKCVRKHDNGRWMNGLIRIMEAVEV